MGQGVQEAPSQDGEAPAPRDGFTAVLNTLTHPQSTALVTTNKSEYVQSPSEQPRVSLYLADMSQARG